MDELCPRCEEASLQFSDDIILFSMPAQRKAHCPECGFSTVVSEGKDLSDTTKEWTLKNPWSRK